MCTRLSAIALNEKISVANFPYPFQYERCAHFEIERRYEITVLSRDIVPRTWILFSVRKHFIWSCFTEEINSGLSLSCLKKPIRFDKLFQALWEERPRVQNLTLVLKEYVS